MISLSKIDAATRELHLAIELHFRDADPIGVHALAGSAHTVLRDLLKHRDGPRNSGTPDKDVQPGSQHFVAEMAAKAKNFLKHADRDPEEILEFDPNWTDFLIFEAIVMHLELTLSFSDPNAFFLMWLAAKYPNVLLLDRFGDDFLKLKRIFPTLGTPANQKRTFLAAMNSRSAASS
jgi:hypothetical protein